jgi:hypothetical protein
VAVDSAPSSAQAENPPPQLSPAAQLAIATPPAVVAPASSPPPETRPAFRASLEFILGLAVLLLIAGGYFGYRVIFPKPVPAAVVVRPVHPAPAHKPAPIPHPAQLARKLSVANAAVKAESAELKAVMQTGAPAAAKPAAAPLAAVAAPPTPVTEPAAPSPAFQAYVEGLIINGVFQGDPPRILVGGRLLRQGDVLDPTLGVVFVTVDPANGRVIFKDRTGATMTKRY